MSVISMDESELFTDASPSRAQSCDLDMRFEAERRAKLRMEAGGGGGGGGVGGGSRSMSVGGRRRGGGGGGGAGRRSTLLLNAADPSLNRTPQEAALAEMDFIYNGSRARAGSGEFIPPRWVPDPEANNCGQCSMQFDWVNRKHHCRHCGKIFCDSCSCYRDLLPHQFGISDPQRVCRQCHSSLLPLQASLTQSIANHQKRNAIDKSGRCVANFMNMPYSSTLESEIRKAAYSTYNLFQLKYIKDKAIPLRLISRAYGLAFLTVAKAGIGIGGKFGTGLVIARLQNGQWSAPCAIGTVGVIWGMLAGADLTDYVVILNTPEALHAFAGVGQLSIGADIDVAIGPIGRSGKAEYNMSDVSSAAAFSYSHSRGLYAGVSLDGSVILTRNEVNSNFYGRHVTPQEILSGMVPRPRAAEPLYEALQDAMDSLFDPNYSHRAAAAAAAAAASIGEGDIHSLNNSPIRPGGGTFCIEEEGSTASAGFFSYLSPERHRSGYYSEESSSPFKGSPTVFGSTSSWVPEGEDPAANHY